MNTIPRREKALIRLPALALLPLLQCCGGGGDPPGLSAVAAADAIAAVAPQAAATPAETTDGAQKPPN